jgi:hypothetical protein
MYHDLTKPQKKALREAANLAFERDTSMPLEDRDVHYLQARSADLPLVVAAAVVDEFLTRDDIGVAVRPLIDELATWIAEVRARNPATPAEPPVEAVSYDPNAVVSIAAIVYELDMLTSSDDTALYVNRETGEVLVDLGSEFDAPEEIDFENDDRWVYLFNRFSIDDMHIMKKFARNASPAASQELLNSLSGRGAYRRYRDVIHRRGLQREFDAYREGKLADLVRFELEQRKIPFKK